MFGEGRTVREPGPVTSAISSLWLLLFLSATGVRADWPGFRGPEMAGWAVTGLPAFQAGEPIALEMVWKKPIGSGYSCVAVAEDRLVTLYSDGSEDWLAGFDASDGGEVWRVSLGATYGGHDGSFTGPVATPWIEGDLVFGLGPHGRLVAVAHGTGDVRWSIDLVADHEVAKPEYGFGSSPIVIQGTLVITPGIGGTLCGLDPATGAVRWSAGSDTVAYQHAVPWRRGDATRVFAGGESQVFEVDPADGRIVWQAAHGGDEAMGAFSLVPVVLSREVVLLKHRGDASTAWEISSGRFSALWQAGSLGKSYSVPVYHEGFVYGYRGLFTTCVDAWTGERKWQSRSPGDGFPVVVDDRLVVVTKRGSLHVLEADPGGYGEVAGMDVVAPPSWSLPAVSGNRVFVRGIKEWARVDVMTGAAASLEAAPDDDSVIGRLLAAGRNGELDAFLQSAPGFPWIEGEDTVHFIYRGEAADVAVGGDMIGTRQMAPMKRVPDTDCFYYSMQLAADARCNYAFAVDGRHVTDPANERATTSGWYRPNMDVGDGTRRTPFSWFAMPKWAPPVFPGREAGAPGQLIAAQPASAALGRTVPIKVYLPDGFERVQQAGLALVHGGSGALAHGDWVRALDRIVGVDVGPVVVVFLPEEQLKVEADVYAQVACGEILPWVLETYPSIGGPARRAHVGMGLGGYSALYCALKYPEKTKRVGTQSVLMLDKMERALEALAAEADVADRVVYMDWGRYDLRNTVEAWDMGAVNREWFTRLRDAGATMRGGEVCDGTGWASWKNRTDALLRALFE